MTISLTPLHVSHVAETAGETLDITTSSFTPPDNGLLVAVLVAVNDPGGNIGEALTVSGGNLTWTRRVSRGTVGPSRYSMSLEIWTAPVGTGAPMAIRVTAPTPNGGDACRVGAQVIGFTGHDTTTPTGADGENDITGNGAHSLALVAAPAATSYVIAARGYSPQDSSEANATPGTGWIEVYDFPADGYGALQTQYRTGSTSEVVSWANVSDQNTSFEMGLAVALEIRAGLQPAALLIGV